MLVAVAAGISCAPVRSALSLAEAHLECGVLRMPSPDILSLSIILFTHDLLQPASAPAAYTPYLCIGIHIFIVFFVLFLSTHSITFHLSFNSFFDKSRNILFILCFALLNLCFY